MKTSETTQADKPENPIRVIIEHIDEIKAQLGDVVRELAGVTGLLKQVEKEKKASDKEIESVREKLREIQRLIEGTVEQIRKELA